MKKNVLGRILTVSMIALLAACGDPATTENAGETATEATQTTEDPALAAESISLELAGTDQMTFDKEELTVRSGQKVTLTLTHTGTMAKSAMGHNFVLLADGTDLSEFGQKAAAAADNDYIPADAMDKIIAHTKLIGGGESTTVEFTAPAAGTYLYICSFPGHYATMKGVLTVK